MAKEDAGVDDSVIATTATTCSNTFSERQDNIIVTIPKSAFWDILSLSTADQISPKLSNNLLVNLPKSVGAEEPLGFTKSRYMTIIYAWIPYTLTDSD